MSWGEWARALFARASSRLGRAAIPLAAVAVIGGTAALYYYTRRDAPPAATPAQEAAGGEAPSAAAAPAAAAAAAPPTAGDAAAPAAAAAAEEKGGAAAVAPEDAVAPPPTPLLSPLIERFTPWARSVGVAPEAIAGLVLSILTLLVLQALTLLLIDTTGVHPGGGVGLALLEGGGGAGCAAGGGQGAASRVLAPYAWLVLGAMVALRGAKSAAPAAPEEAEGGGAGAAEAAGGGGGGGGGGEGDSAAAAVEAASPPAPRTPEKPAAAQPVVQLDKSGAAPASPGEEPGRRGAPSERGGEDVLLTPSRGGGGGGGVGGGAGGAQMRTPDPHPAPLSPSAAAAGAGAAGSSFPADSPPRALPEPLFTEADALYEAAAGAAGAGEAEAAEARALASAAGAGGSAWDAQWRAARVHASAMGRCVFLGDGAGAAAARARGLAAAEAALRAAPACLPAHALAATLRLSAFPAASLPLPELALPAERGRDAVEWLLAVRDSVEALCRGAPRAPATHYFRGAFASAVVQLPFSTRSRFSGSGGPELRDGDALEAYAAARDAAGRAREPLSVAVRRTHTLLRLGRAADAEAALSEWVRGAREAPGAGGAAPEGVPGLALPRRDFAARAEARAVAQALLEKLPRLPPGSLDAAWE
jgi:hypothetical protein